MDFTFTMPCLCASCAFAVRNVVEFFIHKGIPHGKLHAYKDTHTQTIFNQMNDVCGREKKGSERERDKATELESINQNTCASIARWHDCSMPYHTAHTYFPLCHAKEYRTDEAREKKWMMRRKKNQYISSALNSIYEVNV